MSKNRPKIWLNKKEYIYRTDFNWRKNWAEYKKEKISDEEILASCFKHSHEYGMYKKGDLLKIKFNPNRFIPYYDAPCYANKNYYELMRVDYNGNDEPEILLVRPVNYYCQLPVTVSGKNKDTIIGKKEELDGKQNV